MKNYFALALFSLLLFGCSTDQIEEGVIETNTSTSEFNKEIFSFKNEQEFVDRYEEFSKLSIEELEMNSFFSFDRNIDASPAIQGILNDDNEFKVAGKTIWFDQGNFYEIDDDSEIETQKKSKKGLKVVGSVSTSNEDVNTNSKYVIMNVGNAPHPRHTVAPYQRQFRKQRYVEDCGNGKIQGPSRREFKYVNELYSEYVNYSNFHAYTLYLRVKLEYNIRGRSWRLSGEGREISIDFYDQSTLRHNDGTILTDYSQNPPTFRHTFSSDCASHQYVRLRYYYTYHQLSPRLYHWKAGAFGTITQKMVGDVESNRWTSSVSF